MAAATAFASVEMMVAHEDLEEYLRAVNERTHAATEAFQRYVTTLRRLLEPARPTIRSQREPPKLTNV
jgi:hypothetical protein